MGLLVEKDDINGLADAMQYLIDNPNKIKEFGENVHRFAEEELNWDRIVGKIDEEIKKRRGLKN